VGMEFIFGYAAVPKIKRTQGRTRNFWLGPSPGAEGKRGRRETGALLSVKLNDRIMQLIGPLSTTVVSMQAAMALPATAPVPLAVACIPIVIPLTIEVDRMGFPLTDAGKSAMKGLLISSVLQGSLGVIEFLMGDLVTGFVNTLMAGIGMYLSGTFGANSLQ
ncbi:hypothetical protein FOZ63_012918, partial [Perkinsus olseni]